MNVIMMNIVKRIIDWTNFYIKFTAKNYEIPNNIFEEVQIEPYGNCFYCCISFFYLKFKIGI